MAIREDDLSSTNIRRLTRNIKPRRVRITSVIPRESLDEVLENIRDSHGIPISRITLQPRTDGPPIVNRQTHEIIDGNHRYWKAKLQGEKFIWIKEVED